jgi:hypothetical protein
LLNNHLIRLSLNRQARAQKTACWELLDCAKVLCPAHGCKNEDCWLVPRTHCTNMIEEDFFQKLANCLTCSYFNFKAEQYVRGENHFVADQIQRYNVKALEQIYQRMADHVF